MNKPRLALLALSLLLAPSFAAAQTVVYVPWAPPPMLVLQPQPAAPPVYAPPMYAPPMYAPPEAPVSADASRFRFGIAGNLTVGLANDRGHGVNTGVFAPGLTLDLGVQLSRSTAVYLHASAATLLVVNQASAFVVLEYSPADWISLGTGVGWSGMASAFSGNASCCGEVSSRNHWGAIAVPAIVGFNFGRRDPMRGRLRGLRLGMEGALGVEPGSGAMGWHASLSLGYVSM